MRSQFRVPERSGERDAPWCGTQQRLCSLVHSRTCGDRVREGARKGEEQSPRRGSAVAGPDRGLVEVLRTGTVVGLSRRDVGRTKQREHLRIQPTPTSPFQNQPLRPFKSTTTFLLSHSKTPRIQLNLPSHSTQP